MLKDLVPRLGIYKKLKKHHGCVNTVSFNADGNNLVSGSDDMRVIVWGWETGHSKLSFWSGHSDNVFQARFMLYTDDRSLVTCAADGENDLRTAQATELFTCYPLDDSRACMRVIKLNSIAIDPRNPNLFAVAGSDGFTRLYDYTKSELLVSHSNEFIYLSTRDMGLGHDPALASSSSVCSEASEIGLDHSAVSASAMDANDKGIPQVYKGHMNREMVKGVRFFGPRSEYVVSGSDCGRIFIWKRKCGELVRVMEAEKHVVNCIESHPHSAVLASSGIETVIKIWAPKALHKAIPPTNIEERLGSRPEQ
ncbi:DDB1- and CUL4-associated factor 8-like isoform X2 [Hibiscus syriacus]|uniref:DDB1-and CUL4-associated factor 8-like isoform X2 n=1 Tax=Hibiscus syriacus TaxID=106335 RepID=A0A6A3APS1_HIBSY|nr:DDB1- and CUL4-associated factor 8-like isoform X2 [Hibiscus syriacus]